MEQQTTEWLAWRRDKLGASNAPIVMGVSKFSTPHKLWAEMTGKRESFAGNWATERGNFWEPFARSRYELRSDLDLPATIAVHPRYKFITASLDGYNKEAGVVLEIKIPGAEVFEAAKANICHKSYYPQVQQQLMVTGAKECHFYCCKVEKDQTGHERIVDDALVIVKPDEAYQKELLLKLIEFYSFVQQDIPPPLTDADYLEADDQSSVFLFSKMKQIKLEIVSREKLLEKVEAELARLEAELGEVREEAIEHVETFNHPRVTAVGVNMSKNKAGSWSVRLAAEEKETA